MLSEWLAPVRLQVEGLQPLLLPGHSNAPGTSFHWSDHKVTYATCLIWSPKRFPRKESTFSGISEGSTTRMVLSPVSPLSGIWTSHINHLTSLVSIQFLTISRRARHVEHAQPNPITSNAMKLSSMRAKRGLDQSSTARRIVSATFSPPFW